MSAMSGENCLVCATDEGVFLDVVEQPSLTAKAQTCRLEVSDKGLSTKVCHKCAFEIDQCHNFVVKVKAAANAQSSQRESCVLCLDVFDKSIFFDLSKLKFGVNDFLQRTRDLFADEFKNKELQKQLVCLSCRYFVDLLTDLRNISDEVPSKLKTIVKNGINPANLPKIKTSIVNRNTTLIQSNLDLNTPSDTDSESSSIMASKKKSNKSNKSVATKPQEKCRKCRKPIKGSHDTYKIYQTGVIVCKSCWLTIDPGKTPSKKRKKTHSYPKTKLCSILVPDVLQFSSSDHTFQIEKDIEGNTHFKVSTDDDKTENRTESVVSDTNIVENFKINQIDIADENEAIKKTKPSRVTNRRRKESEQSIPDYTEVKSTRNRRKESEQSSQNETEIRPTRSNRRRKESENSIQEDVEVKASKIEEGENSKPTRITRRRKDSEQSVQEIKEERPVRVTRRRKESELSNHDESEIKITRSTRSRKDSEKSVQETVEVKSTKGVRRRKESEQSIQEDVEVNVDVDSDTAPVLKKAKKSETTAKQPKQSSKSKSQSNASVRKRSRSNSIESSGSTRKSARNAKKNKVIELDEIIEIDDDSDSDNVQKENVLDNDDASPKNKRIRIENINEPENSDVESIKSEKEGRSKRSSSLSSKESTPASKFKTPPKKGSVESSRSIKDLQMEEKDKKPSSSKILNAETSESEEIDILRSTDEETKGEDTLDIETEDKDISASKADEDEKSNDSKLQVEEQVSTSADKNSKTDHEDFQKDTDKSDEEMIPDSPTSTKIINLQDSPKLVIEEKSKSEDRNSTENINDKNNVTEEDKIEKEEKQSPSRRASPSSSKSGKTKSGGKKSKKNTNATENDITIYDTSDSENSGIEEEIIDSSYTCTICDKPFENKLIGLQHELTHMKVLEIKLPKVENIQNRNSVINTELNKNTEVDSQFSENVANDIEEKIEIDNQGKDTNSSSKNENEEEQISDTEMINEKEPDSEENKNLDANVEETEEDECNPINELDKNEQHDNVDEQEIAKDVVSEKSENEDDDVEDDNALSKKRSSRRSTRIENKSDRKSRGRRKTTNDILESEEKSPMTIDIENDKIAEAVQETLNDMAELHGKMQATSAKEAQESDKITQPTEVCNLEKKKDNENDIEVTNSTEIEQNEKDIENAESIQDNNAMEINEIENDTSKFNNKEMECDSVKYIAESKDEREVKDAEDKVEEDEKEQEKEEEVTPIVDVDAESSREVVDVELEAAKQAEESEVEITEIDEIEAKSIEPAKEIQCEQVDLTENDDCEIPKPDDDIEIEEVIESNTTNIHEDENTVDSVTEINVIAEGPCVENNAENPGKEQNEVVEVNNEDDENNTEDEALAQESLEELMQRKGLQVIDEFAESVTDGDEESEKEANVSSEKENRPEKDADTTNEIEIKISDAECTEILGVHNKSITKPKENEISIVDENQIIQDVDVVEEVIHDSEVIQEVEVESNVVN